MATKNSQGLTEESLENKGFELYSVGNVGLLSVFRWERNRIKVAI